MQSITNKKHPKEEHVEEKTTNYFIVTFRSKNKELAISNLSRKVNSYIQRGWQPQGGVSIAAEVTKYSVSYIASQAMIKTENIK